ncbi:hypothetical protein [Geomonas terrae]|uniref:hypothetical protein n=1 Tax=Geomonas terrae TaxID=2562681 RepID=UPI0013A5CD44|nr:hypothetical protein [Geomonas terrae]
MQLRVETRIDGKTAVHVMAAEGMSDGDLAAVLEDAVIDLRWRVMEKATTTFSTPD